jgi:hypothetical protein
MESRRANRRLIAILGLGVLICAVAFGVRLVHRKPIHGVWMGYSYAEIDGRLIPNEEFGQFVIRLDKDGKYEENGNSTSGTWTQVGDKVTLTPTKFYDLTPDEHRNKYRKKDGTTSPTIERLLDARMKPMVVDYHALADRLVYTEPTLRFEYERYR